MSIKINYKKNILKKSSKNLIFFVEEGFVINRLKKYLSNIEFIYINDLLKNSDLKKEILFFEINSKKKIFLVSIKKNLKNSEIENLGAKFHAYVNYDKNNDYSINSETINDTRENFVGYFLHGLKLKSYEFSI